MELCTFDARMFLPGGHTNLMPLFFIWLATLTVVCIKPASTNKNDVLVDKFRQMTELSDKSPILKLSYDQFTELVRAAPRNYSVFSMLTALADERRCHSCQAANDEFNTLASSWQKLKNARSKIFLLLVDFDENPKIFKELNQNTVPVFIHFPPSGGPSAADFLDISRSGFGAETLARWIFSRTSVEIPIVRQTSYAGAVLLLIIAGLVGTMLYLRPDNLEFIIHRSTLSYAAMVLIFYIISGQVWNSIRRPPFFHNQPQGGIAFLYPGGDFQFISETILVMVTYVLVSISILMLVEAGQTEDFGKKRMMAIGGLSLFSIFVSLILSLFRRKYQGYPYSFLLK